MATWGDFIKEIPIINKRSEGIFVKADHVLDLWEDRNKLRAEVAKLLQAGGGGVAAVDETALAEAVAREREACAVEVENMAEALAAEPEPQEQLIQMLRAVANLIREKGAQGDYGEAPLAEEATEAPMAEEATEAPMAEPLEEAAVAEPVEGQATPAAEPVAREPLPWEKPQPPTTGEEQPSPWLRNDSAVVENLEREGLPPAH